MTKENKVDWLLYAQYLGACSLLARLSGRKTITAEDLACIKLALDDCAKATDGRFEVVRAGSGFSLEPKR